MKGESARFFLRWEGDFNVTYSRARSAIGEDCREFLESGECGIAAKVAKDKLSARRKAIIEVDNMVGDQSKTVTFPEVLLSKPDKKKKSLKFDDSGTKPCGYTAKESAKESAIKYSAGSTMEIFGCAIDM